MGHARVFLALWAKVLLAANIPTMPRAMGTVQHKKTVRAFASIAFVALDPLVQCSQIHYRAGIKELQQMVAGVSGFATTCAGEMQVVESAEGNNAASVKETVMRTATV